MPFSPIPIQGLHCTGKTGKITQKCPCQGKHRELGHFAKTQGIWFARVGSSVILTVQDVVIFAAKFPVFSKSVLLMKLSQISEIGTGNISSWTGVGKNRENTGNL